MISEIDMSPICFETTTIPMQKRNCYILPITFFEKRGFSNLTLGEKIKPVNMEKFEFEKTDLSILGMFWRSGTIRIPTQGANTKKGKM